MQNKKKRADGNFLLKGANEHLLLAVVIKGSMIWGSKCHLLVCDGYVKYEEAEVYRLVAILKANNCGGGGPCGIR